MAPVDVAVKYTANAGAQGIEEEACLRALFSNSSECWREKMFFSGVVYSVNFLFSTFFVCLRASWRELFLVLGYSPC